MATAQRDLCRRCGRATETVDMVRVASGPWGAVCPDCAMELAARAEEE